MDTIWLLIKFLALCWMVSLAAALTGIQNETTPKIDDTEVEFPNCHLEDPDAEDCVLRAAKAARAVLARGSPALGVPALEPLRVPSVRLRQHSRDSHALNYDAWLTDVMLKGLTDYEFQDLEINPDGLTVEGNVSLPGLQLDAEYILLGHFQMLPVEATGRFMANFTTCTGRVHAVAARLRGGGGRLVVRDASVRLDCADMLAAHLDDSYSGDDDKSKITQHIINMHSSEIVSEVKPAVETALGMLLEDVANKFLKGVPMSSEQLLPK